MQNNVNLTRLAVVVVVLLLISFPPIGERIDADYLAYIGAAFLAAAVLTLGVGLIRAARRTEPEYEINLA